MTQEITTAEEMTQEMAQASTEERETTIIPLSIAEVILAEQSTSLVESNVLGHGTTVEELAVASPCQLSISLSVTATPSPARAKATRLREFFGNLLKSKTRRLQKQRRQLVGFGESMTSETWRECKKKRKGNSKEREKQEKRQLQEEKKKQREARKSEEKIKKMQKKTKKKGNSGGVLLFRMQWKVWQ